MATMPDSPDDNAPPEALTQGQYRAVLEWYSAMGVDIAVSDSPTDWFTARFKTFRPPQRPQGTTTPQTQTANTHTPGTNRATAPSPPSPVPPPAPTGRSTQNVFSGQPVDAAKLEARTKADHANSVEELRALVESFEGCPLKVTANKTCFADGNANARLMVIGEAPGRDEDIQGKPFVGRAGQLLTKMLSAIALDRQTDCYVTNIVYWRPPGNRNPSVQEIEICKPFLERQIQLVDPDAILLLGAPAAKSVLNSTTGILRLRGKWKEIIVGDKNYPAIATLHPAYLLRTPAAKMLAWQDLLSVREKLGT